MNVKIKVCLLLILGLAVSPARAADDLTGIFAAGDCRKPEWVIIRSGLTAIQITEDHIYMEHATKVMPRAGWQQYFMDDSAWYFARRLDRNRVEYTFPPRKPKQDGVAVKPDTKQLPEESWPRETYQACTALPANLIALHGEAMALFLDADKEIGACRHQEAATCIHAVFGLIDVTGDKRLSTAEIARAVRVAAYFSAAADFSASSKDLAKALLWTHAAGPLIGQTLIGSYDYDADGMLSIEEISLGREQILADGWSGKITDGGSKAAREVLDSLQRLPRVFRRFIR